MKIEISSKSEYQNLSNSDLIEVEDQEDSKDDSWLVVSIKKENNSSVF
jgi:hypothetical protein